MLENIAPLLTLTYFCILQMYFCVIPFDLIIVIVNVVATEHLDKKPAVCGSSGSRKTPDIGNTLHRGGKLFWSGVQNCLLVMC